MLIVQQSKILDAGMQVEQFRELLDDEAKETWHKTSRAKLNETDMLYPLSLTLLTGSNDFHIAIHRNRFTAHCHFRNSRTFLMEIILIRKRLLIRGISLLESLGGKQIIHIPDGYNHCSGNSKVLDASNLAVHFHNVPRVVFIGLFSWLIIHWMLG